MKTFRSLLLVHFLILFLHHFSFGQNKYIGPEEGLWSVPENWSFGELPDITDAVLISDAQVAIKVNEQAFAGQIEITNSAELIVDGELVITGSVGGASALLNYGSTVINNSLQMNEVNQQDNIIENRGDFNNLGTIQFNGVIKDRNIYNVGGGEFTNMGTIQMNTIGNIGIDNINSTFTNEGKIIGPDGPNQTFINCPASATFNNNTCAEILSYQNIFTAAGLDNDGIIVERSPFSSTIGSNGPEGIVINAADGTFIVLQDDGYLSNNAQHTVWHGCVSNDLNNFDNLARGVEATLNNYSVTVPSSPQGNVFPKKNWITI